MSLSRVVIDVGRTETRQRLVEAAYDVFAEHGIRDTPVELICERAGFTRGAFYSNFASKDDLFLAVYEEQMSSRLLRLEVALTESGDAADLVTRTLRRFMAPLTADRNWYALTVEFRAHTLRRPELRAPAEAAQNRFHDALGRVLETALARSGLRLRVDTRSAVRVLAALYQTALEEPLPDLPLLLSALIEGRETRR